VVGVGLKKKKKQNEGEVARVPCMACWTAVVEWSGLGCTVRILELA
jgi:hypothetical protein